MKLNIRWLFRDLTNQIWFTVALYCLLGIVVALGAAMLKRFIPETISSQIGADAVDRMLGIIAASMLAVATFSLSTMVQAFVSAGSGATPRAAQLVVEDRAAHQALATFIGAFVFSLVGLIALSTGIYGSSGRLLLFLATIGVIVLIVLTLLRWIHRLSRLGRVTETIDQVERAATVAVEERIAHPCLGARPLAAMPDGLELISAGKVGYVRRIDLDRLSEVADQIEQDVYIASPPGAFVTRDRPLVGIAAGVDDETRDRIIGCFLIGDQRSFEHDPRFGLIVLAEIGSRALSQAINDSGTVIDVIGTMVRVLSRWTDGADQDDPEKVKFTRVFMEPISATHLLDDAFGPIARDGANLVEVGVRLQKALFALTRLGDGQMAIAARNQAREALVRSNQALVFEFDRRRLAAAARLDG